MLVPHSKLVFLLDLINSERSEGEVLDFVPYAETLKKGNYFAFLSKNVVKNLGDLSRDSYQPWTGQNCSTNKAIKSKSFYYPLVSTDDGFVADLSGVEEQLKLLTYTHCKCPSFKREIFFVINSSNGKLISDVVYHYIVLDDINTPLNLSPEKRTKPSLSVQIKNALAHRTTDEAKKLLAAEGLQVSTKKLLSLGRNVPTHVKTRIGRKTPTDYQKLTDR